MKLERSTSVKQSRFGTTRIVWGLTAALAITGVGIAPVSVETAEAGELIAGPRRIRQNNQFIRRIERSTNAVKKLRQSNPTKPMSMRESSPYEYRIVEAQIDQAKYEQRLARWEHRVAVKEQRDIAKSRKETERDATKLRKDKLRAQERLARQEAKRQKDRDRELARSARLGQSQQVASNGNGNRTNERFAAPAGSSPRRLTLWQRIKLWFSGGGTEQAPKL